MNAQAVLTNASAFIRNLETAIANAPTEWVHKGYHPASIRQRYLSYRQVVEQKI